jgi:hypothetical protein
VIRPVDASCARMREEGKRRAQADNKLTVMSRRFMVGDAPKRVGPASETVRGGIDLLKQRRPEDP